LGNSNEAVSAAKLFSQQQVNYQIAIGDSAQFSNGNGATDISHSLANLAIGSKAMLETRTVFFNLASSVANTNC
jgi:hypothetical protein